GRIDDRTKDDRIGDKGKDGHGCRGDTNGDALVGFVDTAKGDERIGCSRGGRYDGASEDNQQVVEKIVTPGNVSGAVAFAGGAAAAEAGTAFKGLEGEGEHEVNDPRKTDYPHIPN